MLPLVGLAHGSRDPRAGLAVSELLEAVASLRPGLVVAPAYLDLMAPDLTDALVSLNAPEVVVLPMLFTQAFHAGVDTPEAVAVASTASGTVVRVAGILGMGAEVLRALSVRADEAGIGPSAGIVLAAVGSSSAAANEAVVALASEWSAARGAPVTAAFATIGGLTVSEALASLADVGGGPAAGVGSAPHVGGHRVGVAPLFVAPGLLLDLIARQAAAFDAPVAAPLGTELAELMLSLYDRAADLAAISAS